MSRPIAKPSVDLNTRLALAPEEAAQALGLCLTRMYALMKSGQVTARKVGGRTLIEVSELRRFLEAQPVFTGGERVGSRKAVRNEARQAA